MSVNCKFASNTTDSSMKLDGNCVGLAVFSRPIGARLKTDGNTNAAQYRLGTGPAGLNGKRSGNALDFGIRWAEEVNGDRAAKMKLGKVGTDGMRLTTVTPTQRPARA